MIRITLFIRTVEKNFWRFPRQRKRPSRASQTQCDTVNGKKSHTVCVYQALSSLSRVIANFLYARPMFYVLFGLLCVTTLCVAVDTR